MSITIDEKIAIFKFYCDEYPTLIRESLLVFKTWMRMGNKQKVPYLEATLDDCIEWFQSKVI
jgi:hypothetical protein